MPRHPLRSVVWDTGFVTVPRPGWQPNPAVTYPDVSGTSNRFKSFGFASRSLLVAAQGRDWRCVNFWKLWLPPPVLTAIISGPRPRPTLRVWGVVMAHIERDTGEITASCREVAEDVGTTPDEVVQALNQLTVIGALLTREPDRYAINPHVGWVGDPAKRQEAARDVPPVRLVDPVV